MNLFAAAAAAAATDDCDVTLVPRKYKIRASSRARHTTTHFTPPAGCLLPPFLSPPPPSPSPSGFSPLPRSGVPMDACQLQQFAIAFVILSFTFYVSYLAILR